MFCFTIINIIIILFLVYFFKEDDVDEETIGREKSAEDNMQPE